MLANACIDHLLHGGIFVRLSDDSVLLHADLQPSDGADALRVGQALAEQALLAIVPALFDAGQTEELRRLEAHLRHVTDRALPRAATSSVGLALLCADYYAMVSPDCDLLRHYMTQGCAALDLRLGQFDPAISPGSSTTSTAWPRWPTMRTCSIRPPSATRARLNCASTLTWTP
ncbi:MAG: hypothetical protein HGA45_38225 [Chloroflexales bacterium]|nr:hypothetical protein [Chloroflexales bacterium]